MGSSCIYGSVYVKYQTVIAVPWRILVYKTVWKNFKLLNSDLKFVSVLSNVDCKYYQSIPKKKPVAVQISKRKCTLGSYKREVARSHPLFPVRKQYFFTLKILLALQTHLSMSKLGYIAPSCKNIVPSNTLLVCFFMLNRPPNLLVYSCKNLAIVLTSKDNTMAKPGPTQKFWIKPPWLWCLRATFFIYFFPIYYQVVYLCCVSFCFVAWQDIYFIFAHDLARIFISKKKLPDPSQNQMAIP